MAEATTILKEEVARLLHDGGVLRRERTGYFYVDGWGGLTTAEIRKLERDGVLRRVGIDTYALANRDG